MSSAAVSASSVQTLFYPETGMITPEFEAEMALAGTVIPQIFPEYSVGHIRNVDAARFYELVCQQGVYPRKLRP